MTTPDIAGLCERLQMIVSELQGLPHVVETCREGKDTLERQAAEIKRLRATLGYYSYADDGGKRARAALTGEDTTGSPTSQNTEPGLPFSDAGEP